MDDLIVDVARPVTAFRHPSALRAQGAAAIALQAWDGPMERGRLMAALFLADAAHYADWGRPVYGETWMRTRDGVWGIVLAAALHDSLRAHVLSRRGGHSLPTDPEERRALLEAAADATSQSDVEAIEAAVARLRTGDPEALTRGEALYGAGGPGTLIDWRDALPPERRHDPDALDHLAMGVAHGAF